MRLAGMSLNRFLNPRSGLRVGLVEVTVLGKSMIQTECCISRCDGLIYKYQENLSYNAGDQNLKTRP